MVYFHFSLKKEKKKGGRGWGNTCEPSTPDLKQDSEEVHTKMQMCAVTQLVRLGIDTTVQQNLAACLTMPTDFPAPGSADSFVPSPQFGLLQQFHFIFGKSY